MGILNRKSRFLKLIFFSLCSVMLSNCEKDSILSLNRQDFLNNNLRTDGYFYFFSDRVIDTKIGEKYFEVFFIFKNGIYVKFLYGGYNQSIDIKNRISKLDNDVKLSNRFKQGIDYKLDWGIFKTSGSEIEIERWATSSGAGAYPTEFFKGEIKNDTTIHFHTRIAADPLVVNAKKKTFSIDETYNFRQFSPKPDSTNKFIK
jgi:hypothetical protein